MKLVVDKDYRNSRGKKPRDGKSVKIFPGVILNGTPVPGKNSVDDLDSALPIEFGAPWKTHYDIERPLDPEEKEIYEWFCCGYLYRQEEVATGVSKNHGIHFDWKGSKEVSIYIYPSSTGIGVDPTPPPPPPPPPDYI